jgi:hypothetical protein
MKRLSIVSMAVSVSSALRPNGAARAADQIYACVNNSSGAVKLVAQNTTCKNNETLAGWTNWPARPLDLTGPRGQPG